MPAPAAQLPRSRRPGRFRPACLRILGIALLCCLCACTRQEEPAPLPQPKGVADLTRYTQLVGAYTGANAEEPLLSTTQQNEFDRVFDRKFFAPWRLRQASLDAGTAFWGIKHYADKEGFAENLLPWRPEAWQRLVATQRVEAYPSLARPAITVRNASLRLFPTERPFFLDPDQPGEGFPFDYFQSSAISAGTPLFATHASSDGAWIFVECGFAFGWLPADAVAWANPALRKRYENGRYAAILRDDTTLRSMKGDFLTQADLGAIFPLAKKETAQLRLYVPVRGADGEAQLRIGVARSAAVAEKPLALTRGAISRIADPLLGQAYGWGGLFDNRDCSAMMRDLFVPFGVWLGRNSQAQGQSGGALHDLRGMSAEEKQRSIIDGAIPFATLIWLKGHIGLYLGIDQQSGEPLLLHNVWGVHTLDRDGRAGREVIGRLVITGLRPGEERPDVPKGAFYERIQGFTIVTER